MTTTKANTYVMETYHTREEAAAIIRRSPGTLANWGVQGIGPRFLRMNGGKTLYPASALREWLEGAA